MHPPKTIHLYRTVSGLVSRVDGTFSVLDGFAWDDLFLDSHSMSTILEAHSPGAAPPEEDQLLPPIGAQEVWAAGVTYSRSKTARMDESDSSGGGDFYDRVYDAYRPEIFFKATPHRVSGPGGPLRVRSDSNWSVPEPELAVALRTDGSVLGYTIGNDMSARDIEGENPLYLPQAKVYDQSCGLGPSLAILPAPLGPDTSIRLEIFRNEEQIVGDSVRLGEMKRSVEELASFLFRDNSFPKGCFLLTGTGIVPPDAFSLQKGDRVRITIDELGTLENYVVADHDE